MAGIVTNYGIEGIRERMEKKRQEDLARLHAQLQGGLQEKGFDLQRELAAKSDAAIAARQEASQTFTAEQNRLSREQEQEARESQARLSVLPLILGGKASEAPSDAPGAFTAGGVSLIPTSPEYQAGEEARKAQATLSAGLKMRQDLADALPEDVPANLKGLYVQFGDAMLPSISHYMSDPKTIDDMIIRLIYRGGKSGSPQNLESIQGQLRTMGRMYQAINTAKDPLKASRQEGLITRNDQLIQQGNNKSLSTSLIARAYDAVLKDEIEKAPTNEAKTAALANLTKNKGLLDSKVELKLAGMASDSSLMKELGVDPAQWGAIVGSAIQSHKAAQPIMSPLDRLGLDTPE